MEGREIIQEFAHDNMKSWELSSERIFYHPICRKEAEPINPESDKDKYVCTPCSDQNVCGNICLKTEQVEPIIPESDPESDKDKYVCTPCSNQNECGSICLKTKASRTC